MTILKKNKINVIGGGLAGSECCYQLLTRGYDVTLYEMKPKKYSPAHSLPDFCELVCSNSLKSANVTSACGLLKEEMRRFDSLTILTADKCRVPAGNAIAVDREVYAREVTKKLLEFPNLTVVNEEVEDLSKLDGITVVATGPLTSEPLQNYLKNQIEDFMYFYDAASPIVSAESIDYERAFFGDRYDKGDSDYLNCGMNKEEYTEFYNALVTAESVILKDFEKKDVFESCMPIEIMAKRGMDTMRFGPMKPVGLYHNGQKFYAVLQLRYENAERTMFNLVGFQTNLKFPEQKRVFSMIPALKNAEYLRYGVMHRNTFVNAPKVLNMGCQYKKNPNVFFAGQITGVEGYVESAMSGLYTALQIHHMLEKGEMFKLSNKTMMGALVNYISSPNEKFQPMNSNYGIVDSLETAVRIKGKQERYKALSEIALMETDKDKIRITGE